MKGGPYSKTEVFSRAIQIPNLNAEDSVLALFRLSDLEEVLMLSLEHVKLGRNRISTMLRGPCSRKTWKPIIYVWKFFSTLLGVVPLKMCPRTPYFYRMPNISLRVSLMSEIALLSSRAVIVGVVHITLVVHIRPVSPISTNKAVQ